MFCPYCGQRFDDKDNFCTRCGKPRPVLSEQQTPNAALSQPPSAQPPATARRNIPAAPAVPARQNPQASSTPGQARPVTTPAGTPPFPSQRRPPAYGGRFPASTDHSAAVAGSPAPRAQAPRNPYAEAGTARPSSPSKPAKSQKQSRSSRRGEHRAKDWGGAATAAGTVVALLASIACAALLFASSLVATPLFAEASGDASEVVHVMLTSIDPSLSVVVSSFLDRGSLSLLDIVLMTPAFSGPLSAGYISVCVGVLAGVAVGASALLVVGTVATLVRRRPSLSLAFGSIMLAAVALAVAFAASWVDRVAMAYLRNDLSMAFATAGVQLSGSAHVTVALSVLYVIAGLGALGFVAALWARVRWGRLHRVRRPL